MLVCNTVIWELGVDRREKENAQIHSPKEFSSSASFTYHIQSTSIHIPTILPTRKLL